MTTFDKIGADRMADEIQALIIRRVIDHRSPAADALLDYRDPPSSRRADRLAALDVAMPHGFKIAPLEPTAEIIADMTCAVWPTPRAEDCELARRAALLVLKRMTTAPGATLDSIAAAIATMAPAYRAAIAAVPELTPPLWQKPSNGLRATYAEIAEHARGLFNGQGGERPQYLEGWRDCLAYMARRMSENV